MYSNQSEKYKYCFKQETKNKSKWLKQILSELLSTGHGGAGKTDAHMDFAPAVNSHSRPQDCVWLYHAWPANCLSDGS